ncbi:MAG TPA: hypothetical protein VF018_10070 [Acidobacteriaceae bacterium]
MQRKFVRLILVHLVVLAAAWQAQAEDAKTPYPEMAPLHQYLIADRDAEIALARSAAPKSISDQAEILVLTEHGYETAVKGTNGFVCVVERSWTAGADAPDFWNPKVRSPFCLNAPAVETYLPLTILKTKLAMEGKSKPQIVAAIQAALEEKKLAPIARGAMCYMMSKQGYLNDAGKHWHPHLMFFAPTTKADAWGANLDNSPILAVQDSEDRITIFMVPLPRWSDGTADSNTQ